MEGAELHPGIYHLTAEGACSWAEFTAEAFAQLGVTCRVIAVDREGDCGRIRRPAYSVLANTRARKLGITLPHRKDDLARPIESAHPWPLSRPPCSSIGGMIDGRHG